MRVGVDGRSLRSSARSRGITRYVVRLVSALARAFPEDEYALLVPGGAGPAAAALNAAGVTLHTPKIDSRPLFATAALSGRPRADRLLGGCDVMFVPAVAPLAVSAGMPVVVTVHDLSFEHHPGDFSAYERTWHRVARPRRLARRAARVITVSEAVRREILSEWGLPTERIVVVPSGPGSEPGSPSLPPPGVPQSYVLAVGALEPRKCPDLLVEAHARARKAGLEAGLVLAGEGPLRQRLAASHATLLGYVEDGDLDSLYADALALVCVSREEGFSFTPLEALARGTPAIVSDLPVFAETVGMGALRVPAGDAEALARALLRLERERPLREELVAAGRNALSRLSWERAAEATRAVLLEAAAAGPGPCS